MSSYPTGYAENGPDHGLSASASRPVFAAEHSANSSAVSWAAILAGATAAAVLSLILLVLGTGLGLSALSPWAPRGISAKTFGISAIVWIAVTQIMSSGMGGYLAGRLRTRWVSVHGDEVYFRDTAHGFLAWAIASLATAAVLSSVTDAVVGNSVQAGAAVAGAATAGAAATAGSSIGAGAAGPAGNGVTAYFVDTLFRRDLNVSLAAGAGPSPATPGAEPAALMAASAAEVSRIFVNAMRAGAMPSDDSRYVAQVIAQRAGLSQAEAEKRVNDSFARVLAKSREADTAAREVADKARKASVYATLWIFVSLLIGAFAASLAATYGGRERDLQTHLQTA